MPSLHEDARHSSAGLNLFDGWLITAVYPDGAVFAWHYSLEQHSEMSRGVAALLNTEGVIDVRVQVLGVYS